VAIKTLLSGDIDKFFWDDGDTFEEVEIDEVEKENSSSE
jgi:hypothetical protein